VPVDIVALRCFVAVAEEGHFGRAGARLGYTTSNISHRIRSLERELGVRLFARTSRQVALSPAGRALLPQARAVVDGTDRLVQLAAQAAEAEQRSLRIAYGPYTNQTVRALVQALQHARPDARITIDLLPSTSDVVRAVLDGASDAGVAKSRHPRLARLPLRPPAEFVLLVPEGHRFARRDEVGIHELDGEPLLLVDRDQDPEQHDQIVRFYERLGVRPRFRRRHVMSVDVALDFVATGQGMARVFATTPRPPGTTVVRVSGPQPPIDDLNLVWDPSRRAPLLHDLLAVAEGHRAEEPSDLGDDVVGRRDG